MPTSVNSFQVRRAAAAASRGTTWKSFVRSIFSNHRSGSSGFDADLEAGQDSPIPSGHSSPGPGNSAVLAGDGTDARDQLRRRNTGRLGQSERPGSGNSTEGEETKKKKQRTFFKHVEPKEPFTVWNQIKGTLLSGWINLLLLTIPVGIALNYISDKKGAVFIVNFLAIIPLAKMLSDATEEIALRTGETLGGLLNATFG